MFPQKGSTGEFRANKTKKIAIKKSCKAKYTVHAADNTMTVEWCANMVKTEKWDNCKSGLGYFHLDQANNQRKCECCTTDAS